MLFDSVIVIDYLNAIPEAVSFVDGTPQGVISVITMAEVLAGVEESGFDDVVRFLRSFPIIGIDAGIAESAARLRRVERWKLPDAIQVAVAQYYGWQLATRNTRDFNPDKHDFVLVPYTL